SEKENSNGGAKADETKSAKDGKKGDTVAVIVQEVSKWLEGMITAVEKAAAGGTGGNSKIGDVANNGAGAGGNETSVKDGKKGDTVAVIVQEVSKWLEEMITAVEKAAAGGTGTENSKIGDVANNAAGAKADETKSAKDGKKGDTVAVIVQEVSKWLEGMITAVEKAAAGGTGGNSKIGDVANNAAGAKADDASVKGIALGIKEIVDAAGKAGGEKAGGEKAGGVLKDVTEATGNSNADAGKLFDTNAGDQADTADIGKASAAVGAVSGKQIIKAIVDAAGKDGEHAGKKADDATNPIAAAIGEAGQNGAAFVDDNMKKDDKIAAAIVLRGLAKDGKFAAADADGAKSAKGGEEG
uniref:variable large family protein n=1 Tax=Borreliella bavariensis TaxID=664662 RepID=UPI001F396974